MKNGAYAVERDIFATTFVIEIHAALGSLHQQEATVNQRLYDLIASQKDLPRDLGRLDLLRAHLGTQVINTRAISNGMLSNAATIANRISGAVERLDQEQSNIKATLEVVEQDWETAASYVCQGVMSRARANFNSTNPQQREGYFYASAITKLYEHIAQIVDSHEPPVERHYGPRMMAKVIERLQIEADMQGGIVLDTWHDERILTPANFDRLLAIALTYLATVLQNRIKSYHGLVNELGAVRLERDISGIVNAAVAGGKYGLRDAFAKCTQMVLIMNMEDDEWEEISKDKTGESGIRWVLTADERNFVRGIVKRSR
ncbi:COG4 transport protein-domain-containing protein [Phaeosphaeriaceae sp. PMI808]|nr:COG4 transport protein-domain-containing protein [Phaeosphaeriaceae sp. PMI808]